MSATGGGGGGIERRASPRCPYSATAVVYVGNEQLVCRAVDISSGGMLIIPPSRAQRGSFLRINLSLPAHDEILDLDAIVVREAEVNGRYAWGVAFHQPEPRVVKLLEAFVQWGIARSQRPSTGGGHDAVESRGDASRAGAAVNSVESDPIHELTREPTYGGGAERPREAPLPGWCESDARELEALFASVLAALDDG